MENGTIHYLTPTLFNAWRWYMETSQDRQEFLNVLNRVYKEPSDAIIKGIKFEAAVTEIAKKGSTNIFDEIEDGAELNCAKKIAEIVKGGWFQEVLKMRLTPEIVLYGKSDVIKGPKIYDIKRVKSYEPGKYKNSIQHQMYMLSAHISDFEYLICDGHDVYIESYWEPEFFNLEEIVKGRVNEFLNWLKGDNEFLQAYQKNWRWRAY